MKIKCLRSGIILFFLFLPVGCSAPQPTGLASAPGTAGTCPDWQMEFDSFRKDLASYKQAAKEYLVSQGGQCLISSKSPLPKGNHSKVRIRWGEVSVPATEKISSVMPQFKYGLIPPRKRQTGPPKTVILFPGGPGNSYSNNYDDLQLENYQILFADYIGMGQNQLLHLRSGIDDQEMNLDVYSRLLQLVIEREASFGGIGDIVLKGGSYGSVAATAIATHLGLSKDKRFIPKLVVLTTVATFRDISNRQEKREKQDQDEVEWFPKFINNKICVLPQGSHCFEDSLLNQLEPALKVASELALQKVFKNYDRATATPFQKLLRDAFHWEAAQSPGHAKKFLKAVVREDGEINYSSMSCWLRENFDSLPWYGRYKSASLTASIESHTCPFQIQENWEAPHCSCFKSATPYEAKNYQIPSSVAVLYINGDQDTQTPLLGALSHFEAETKAHKKFIKLCGLGHDVIKSGPRSPKGAVDLELILDQFFKSGLGAIQVSDGC